METAAAFEAERPRLLRLARRIVGTATEAEDVVQAAWLRFSGAVDVVDPAAWLTRTVSRLALDQLRAARRRREVYVGPWLPEPVEDDGPDAEAVDAALMLALERLSPLERAAFLLHDVFGESFASVAAILDREEAAVRQLAARARRHLAEKRPRFDASPKEHEALALAFHQAARSGDTAVLARMLAPEVVVLTDGGGIRPAALNPIRGLERTLRFYAGLALKASAPASARFAVLDGLPGIVTVEADGLPQTTSLVIEGGVVAAILIVRNPEKLRHIGR